MSFSRGSFKASTLPAALWNDVSLEEAGMLEEEEEEQQEEPGEATAHENFEMKRSAEETEVTEETEGDDKRVEHLPKDSPGDGDDQEAQETQESTSLEAVAPSQQESAEVLFPELTEEAIKGAILEILAENSLSQGESLKVWKQAIAAKLAYPSNTIPKSWSNTILALLQTTNEPSSPGSTAPSQSEDAAPDTEEAPAEPVNEELAVVQALEKAVVSKRTAAVLELLERDEEEIELKAGQLRSSLLQRVKQRTQPQVEHFRREINALKDVKRAMKAEGLLDAFSVIAQEKGIILDEEESEESEGEDNLHQKEGDGMIALSDDDDDDVAENEDHSESDDHVDVVQTPKVPICGGRVKPVVRVGGNSARLSLKSQLQQKTLLQSSDMVAKRFGLTNSHELVTVLGGMELERRRFAAKRAEIESEMAEKERKIALERKERARKFQEELALRADDSEGEFDEKDESFAATVIPVSETTVPSVELGDSDDEEEENEEMDEEEELLILHKLQSLEEAEAEKEDSAGEESESDEDETPKESEDLEQVRSTPLVEALQLSDLPVSESEDALPATQIDDGELRQTSDPVTSLDMIPDLSQQRSDVSQTAPVASKRAKNSIYAQMLLDEERQAKKQKTTPTSKFLEIEAEEDEEEGRQAGLGDFGFVIQKTHEDEDEAALKLRATDLENIVDDLSDGEGDEEEGDRQRLEEEARQDRLKTKRILEALASGQKGVNRSSNEFKSRGLYGLDELVTGDIVESQSKKKDEDDEADGADFDFDDDEELQARYLNQMKSRIRGQRQDAAGAIDELSDEEEEDDDLIEDEAVATLTPEERAQKAKIAAIEKENYRRYFEQALRNRALRMNSQQLKDETAVPLSPLSQLGLPQMMRSSSAKEAEVPLPTLSRAASTSVSMGCPPLVAVSVSREGSELKRRVSMPPRKVESQNGRIPRVRNNGTHTGGQGKKPSAAKSDFTGVLNKDELEAGHGMFMSVSLSKRRRASEESSNSSLFSDAVNRKPLGGSVKRSFTSVISRRQSLNSVGGAAITVSSSQFVFLEDTSRTVNSSHDDHTTKDQEASSSAMERSLSRQESSSRKRQIPSEESSAGSGLKRSKTLPSPGTSSLFDKLVERAGPVMPSRYKTPVTSASSHSAGKKLLLAAGRIRSN